MKKSLIIAAVTAAAAVPSVNAGVVVYGKIHASIDYLDTTESNAWYEDRYNYRGPVNYEDGGNSWSEKAWFVSSRASRIGFKGTEDLGNGLSLIWKAETTYNLDDGGWGSGRNAYIGLTGDWGTFLYGRHDTPMKISTARLDLFSDQLGDYNSTIIGSHDLADNALLGPGFKDERAANAIAYISPNWNGLTIAAAIIPGESPSYDATGIADAYSVAAMYSNNGLYLAAAYEEFGDSLWDAIQTESGLSSFKQWRVGAGYTINAFTFNAVYENQKDGVYSNATYDRDIWQISAAYDFGNNRIKFAYGENKSDGTYSDSMTEFPVLTEYHSSEDFESKNWAIGLDHKLSKRTTAYIQYAAAESTSVSESSEYREDLQNTGRWAQEDSGWKTDYDISGFSMGLIHNF